MRKGRWNTLCMDESIFVYDSLVRAVWAKRGSKPVIRVSGSHQRTCLFGAVGLDGRQLFRQYDKMNSVTFVAFLKELLRKFEKFYLFLDGAPWHRSSTVKKFLETREDRIKLVRFPVCSPELNPVEECWRQSKDKLQANRLHPSFEELKRAIGEWLRTKRFKLDIVNYLVR